MFKRLFGETEAEQLKYLEIRSIITLIAIAGAFFTGGGPLIAIIMLFVWGWGVVKKWFGFTSVAALFSNNIYIAAVLFLFYFMLAYIVGFAFAFIGVGRWIYLRVKYGVNTHA